MFKPSASHNSRECKKVRLKNAAKFKRISANVAGLLSFAISSKSICRKAASV